MQWVNQTYNANCNYGNRNASSNYSNLDIGTGYVGACVASVAIALYTRRLVAPQLIGLTGTKLVFAEAGLNTLAAAGAGWINCALMRQKELFEGVEV